jgi:hypothetical protein
MKLDGNWNNFMDGAGGGGTPLEGQKPHSQHGEPHDLFGVANKDALFSPAWICVKSLLQMTKKQQKKKEATKRSAQQQQQQQ